VAADEPTDPAAGVDLADAATPRAELGPHDDAVAAPPPDEPHDTSSEPARPGRLPAVLPWVLVALAVLAAVFATWRWQELAAQERAREDVAASVSAFVTSLTTWDASAGMSEVREELRAGGTESFARDVDELFGSTEDLAGLAELGARSEGEVESVYVQSLRGEVAEALAVVVQQVSTDTSDFPEVHRRFAEVVLQRVDGRWLVEDLQLLVDTAPSATSPAAPTTSGEDGTDETDEGAAEEGEG
jgi:hypothetical protein